MILLVILALTGALAVLAFVGGQWLGRAAGWGICVGLIAIAGLVASAWSGSGSIRTAQWDWIPALGVSLRLRMDGLSFVFALVVLLVGALVMAYAVNYLPPGRHGTFYALLTFFAAAMIGLVLADDIVLMWVMWEFTTVCSFLLIQQSGPKGKDPALRTLLVTGGGGLCLLGAVTLAWSATGTTTLSAVLASPVWQQRPGLTAAVAVLVALAAFTKSAQFPFHGWLPDAMVASTPVSAYLHAAAMVKAGIYVLLRFSTAFHDVAAWRGMLVAGGLLSCVLGAVYALQRFDLKELLAYSTISQLGLLVATIGIGTGYAIVAAVVHVVAHAIFKSSLFMAVGLVDHETSTRDIRKLSGLRRTMPWTSGALTLGAASMAGIPLFFGFVSKEAIFKAMSLGPFSQGVVVAVCGVAVVGATCTMAYCGRMLRPLFGPVPDAPPHEAPAAMIAPVLVGAVAGLVFGVAGPVLEPLVNLGAQAVLTGAPRSDLFIWHGVNAALMMSLAVLAAGSVLIWQRRLVDRLVVGRALGVGRAVDAVEGFRSGSIRMGRRVGDVTRSDAPYRSLVVPLAVTVAAVVWVAVARGIPVPPVSSTPLDWLMLGLVTFGVVLTLSVRGRVALVTTVGIVGFAVALLFYVLGAPDVAVTQLLVEVLTVVVMVLLLVRLPGDFHVTGGSRSWLSGAIAVVTGAAATAIAAYVLAGNSSVSLGDSYLEKAYELSGGTNVVNTILVDFRAMDTFGEMVVLGVAAVAMLVALQSRGLLPPRQANVVRGQDNPAMDPKANTTAIRVLDRFIVPVLGLVSLWLFLRGHYHVGGGFIGALVAGAAVVLIFLAAADDWVARLHVAYLTLIGSGVVLAAAMGLLGYVDGAFLRPLYFKAFGLSLSTGLVFDVGVYLAVLGLILGALAQVGMDGPEPTPLRRPGALRTREEADN